MTKSSDRFPGLIHFDETLLVADKPPGLLSVPGRGEGKQECLSARIQRDFPDALVVHRLDMATSGLMVFARGAEMQRLLSRMFRERRVEKRYVAVVTGRVGNAWGEIELPMLSDWPNRPRQKVDFVLGKQATTCYRLLGYDALADTSSIELEPVTGRTHQLRVHLAAIGHPILGDALYGKSKCGFAGRMLLHASKLGFSHPLRGNRLSFESASPF